MGCLVGLRPRLAIRDGAVVSIPAFIFEIAGAFPAVAAWVHSGVLPEEQELICGGEYTVVDTVAGAEGWTDECALRVPPARSSH